MKVYVNRVDKNKVGVSETYVIYTGCRLDKLQV